MGGKVLMTPQQFIQKLIAAPLAADVLGVDTVLVARTDADGAGLLTSDIDERDHAFLTGERTAEGFFTVKPGLDQATAPRLLTRLTQTSFGVKRRNRISKTPAVSHTQFTKSFPASCSRTTVRLRSTGRRSSTSARSRSFKKNYEQSLPQRLLSFHTGLQPGV